MDSLQKIGIGCIVAGIGLLLVRCDVKHSVTFIPKGTTHETIITQTHTTVTTPTGRKEVPNYGHGTKVTVDEKGTTIKPVIYGLSNQFGLSTDFNRLGLGWEVAFYKRFALIIGSNFWHMQDQHFDVRFYVAGAYRLPWRQVSNVSIYTGVDNHKLVTAGLFLRFGSK